jgi:hypothetical protein
MCFRQSRRPVRPLAISPIDPGLPQEFRP